MTELQWLIQMLTKQKLSSPLKDLFIERIGEVESNLVPKAHGTMASSIPHASTFGYGGSGTLIQNPVNQIAQTPAAAAALQQREEAIKAANSGKPEPGRTSPRKF